jgi:hypothetical protein
VKNTRFSEVDMFGLNDNQNQNNDIATAPPTVVAQSNMTLPDEGAPALPDEWHAPSNLNSQTLSSNGGPAASVTIGPASASPNPPPVEPAATATTAPDEVKHEDKIVPELSLDNAYIATNPAHAVLPPVSEPAKPTAASLMNDSSEDELMKMKQKALQNLAPLVDHLDQSPEEKFKTTMMLIQASDNADLVKDAYEAANRIKDEKARAQALLDVVNEINYFTHHSAVEASA